MTTLCLCCGDEAADDWAEEAADEDAAGLALAASAVTAE